MDNEQEICPMCGGKVVRHPVRNIKGKVYHTDCAATLTHLLIEAWDGDLDKLKGKIDE